MLTFIDVEVNNSNTCVRMSFSKLWYIFENLVFLIFKTKDRGQSIVHNIFLKCKSNLIWRSIHVIVHQPNTAKINLLTYLRFFQQKYINMIDIQYLLVASLFIIRSTLQMQEKCKIRKHKAKAAWAEDIKIPQQRKVIFPILQSISSEYSGSKLQRLNREKTRLGVWSNTWLTHVTGLNMFLITN